MKTTIELDREQIMESFYDNPYGRYYLVVDDEGDVDTVWADHNRKWDPWHEGAYIFRIPALFPEGSGADTKMAEELLRSIPGGYDYWMMTDAATPISLVDFVHERHETLWDIAVTEALEWHAEEFLKAINLEENDVVDLKHGAAWGYLHEGEPNEEWLTPPFVFVWKGGDHGG